MAQSGEGAIEQWVGEIKARLLEEGEGKGNVTYLTWRRSLPISPSGRPLHWPPCAAERVSAKLEYVSRGVRFDSEDVRLRWE